MNDRNPPTPGNRWTPAPSGRPNTVGLHDRELGELLDRFDTPEEGRASPRRDFVRWPFRRTSVLVRLTHPGGAITTIQVACRNISRGGLAALHNAYLHPGTRCRLTLPHPELGQKVVEGQVVRCSHRSGVIHELGIAFKEPVDVRDLVRPDPLADSFSLERVDPSHLSGTIMCIDESEIDRRIFRHFLRETSLRVLMATSAEDAMGQLDESCELIVCDLSLVREGAFFATLRDRTQAPIVVASSDTSAEVRRVLSKLSADAFVAKPLTQRGLLRAVAEFLVVRRAAGAMKATSGLLPGDVVPHLAQNFLASLPDITRRIQSAAQRNDAPGCRSLCLQISGTAPTVGFKPLGRLAATAAQLLTRSQSVPASIHAVRSLIAACERASLHAA